MLPIGRASESLILQVLYNAILLGLSNLAPATLKVLLLNPTTSVETRYETLHRFYIDRSLDVP